MTEPLRQAFREEIAPLRQDVRVVNELSAELTPLDIQLSSTASRQLDQLNMRWKLLQVARTPFLNRHHLLESNYMPVVWAFSFNSHCIATTRA